MGFNEENIWNMFLIFCNTDGHYLWAPANAFCHLENGTALMLLEWLFKSFVGFGHREDSVQAKIPAATQVSTYCTRQVQEERPIFSLTAVFSLLKTLPLILILKKKNDCLGKLKEQNSKLRQTSPR